MNKFLLVTLIAAVCLSGTTRLLHASDEMWMAPISKIKLDSVPMRNAIEALVATYKRDHPNDSRLSGFIVADGEPSTVTITLDLQNVPFGEACGHLAMAAGYHCSLHNKSLCFYPPGIEGKGATTEVLPLTDQVLRSLKLQDVKEYEPVRAALKERKVSVASIEEAKIVQYEGTRYLIAKGDYKEMAVVRALWTLLDRK